MLRRLSAVGVHVFTSIGAVLGFLALIEAAAHRWEAAFCWLGVALIVDGVDGPLARWLRVSKVLPRFSGERLDLIIDYFTYVVVPAFMIYAAGLMPDGLDLVAAGIILMSSLFHFIDRESKTEDGFFVGFPAIWNVVALYLFVFPMPAELAFAAIVLPAILTFFPIKWVHPVRVVKLRPLTFCVMGAWGVAIAATLAHGFPASRTEQIVVGLSSLYILGVGIARSLFTRPGAVG
ncbi:MULTISPECIES: CDP-alcohol phosphatidyltransferase family protein [Rhodomicrobium]|uniref:CDP-alcohol phosphatidyltransferase family protein n=1 Tax=Rhodomicrobium TaxID=1068 RepID=UPI000B4AA888|nr:MULTISPECIES: CDP-alcohol phosphatidyltransferase family protein [Rhodomicrobium]